MVVTVFKLRGYHNVSTPRETKVGKKCMSVVHADYHNARNGTTESVACFWVATLDPDTHTSIGKSDVQLCCTDISTQSHYVFITNSMSFQAAAYLASLPSYWEVLSFDDVAFDKTAHFYVPSYELLTEVQVVAEEKKYGKRTLFNKMIHKVDAIARFLDFRPGDVVKLTRFSSISGTSIGLRLVIRSDEVL